MVSPSGIIVFTKRIIGVTFIIIVILLIVGGVISFFLFYRYKAFFLEIELKRSKGICLFVVITLIFPDFRAPGLYEYEGLMICVA